MARITLKYDAKNALAQKTLEYILSLGVFKAESEDEELYNPEFVKMILEESKKEAVVSFKTEEDIKQYFASL